MNPDTTNLNHYPTDILDRIRADFGENQQQVIADIQELLRADKCFQRPQLVRATIHLADKDVHRLKKMIVQAKIDWRDILLWAEYKMEDGKTIQIRDFHKAFGSENIEKAQLQQDLCSFCRIPEKELDTSDYFDTLAVWTENIKNRVFKLVVGDCPLEDLEKHISKEEKYTYYHYFKCSCGNYCRSGVCIRSSVPILERMDKLPRDLIATYKKMDNSVIGEDYL